LHIEVDSRRVIAVDVQGFADVLPLVGLLHGLKGQDSPLHLGWSVSCPDHNDDNNNNNNNVNNTQTTTTASPVCGSSVVGNRPQQSDRVPRRERNSRSHLMVGVGLPVAMQRNSARCPGCTVSTDGVTVATGCMPSTANGRRETQSRVKSNAKQEPEGRCGITPSH